MPEAVYHDKVRAAQKGSAMTTFMQKFHDYQYAKNHPGTHPLGPSATSIGQAFRAWFVKINCLTAEDEAFVGWAFRALVWDAVDAHIAR